MQIALRDEARAVTDKASERRWRERCHVWVDRNIACFHQRFVGEDMVEQGQAIIEQADAANGVLVEEMKQATLDEADIDYVIRLSLEAATLNYKRP